MNIILIEDDNLLGSGVKTGLEHFGYSVNWCTTARQGELAIEQQTPNLVILDLGLPDMDGLTLLKRIRKNYADLAVIILTARDMLDDKLKGFNLGADDYLTKPFDMPELEARIRVLLKRKLGVVDNNIVVGNVCLDLAQRRLQVKDELIDLSKREFDLLVYLFENKNRVLSRCQLEQHAYAENEEPESNALEVHVHKLRKKLGNNAAIKTIRGVGYMLNTDALL
ncbi:response regulator [Catenovulum sp. SX2]|uniref:response regulator n=1 Tax=Catenovulum sp. SX2 TaxID=3398614 RepID=UPI003F86B438